jgi:hypothetical protein
MRVEETLDARQTRAAKNQSLFRDANERIESLNESFSHLLPLGDFVCECADNGCMERIALTTREYEALRARGTRFAVYASDAHVWPDVESVVERNERFWVVEKVAMAARIATGLNPRTATP